MRIRTQGPKRIHYYYVTDSSLKVPVLPCQVQGSFWFPTCRACCQRQQVLYPEISETKKQHRQLNNLKLFMYMNIN